MNHAESHRIVSHARVDTRKKSISVNFRYPRTSILMQMARQSSIDWKVYKFSASPAYNTISSVRELLEPI